MSLDSITEEEFSTSDPDFQPGEKVEMVYPRVFKQFPHIDKIGVIEKIKMDGGRRVKAFDHQTGDYQTINFGLRSSLKKVELVPNELFEI